MKVTTHTTKRERMRLRAKAFEDGQPIASWRHAIADAAMQALLTLANRLDKHWEALGCHEEVVRDGDACRKYMLIDMMGMWEHRMAGCRILAERKGTEWYAVRVDMNVLKRKDPDSDELEFETGLTFASLAKFATMAREFKQTDMERGNAGWKPLKDVTDDDIDKLFDWKWADRLPWEQTA